MLLAFSPGHASALLSAPPDVVPFRQAVQPDALFRSQAPYSAPDRFAQSSAIRSQQDHRSREISDQEHAKERRDRGQNKSFDELFQRARSIGRGEYLGVEPDISRNVYRFKFMRTSGQVVWVDMHGETGRMVAERE